MRLLLDTSTFLWFLTADRRLSDRAAAAIRSAENDAWLSVVSFWEILVKHRLGRLPLPKPPFSYIPTQRRRHGIASLTLRERAMVHLPKLPLHHRDPFDRMLVCQSLEHDMLLVTSDSTLASYPVKTFW
ncbi:MAG: type II toxin-antitoxin system VapC family toxin [Vicinamibacteria bacterium]